MPMPRPALFAPAAFAMLAACSTTEINAVEMKAFTESMSRSLAIVNKRLDQMNLPQREADARRASVLANTGYYGLEGDCALKPSPLLTDLETLENPPFGERCRLVGLDATDTPLPFEPPREIDHAEAARRTAADLADYVAAISDLSASEEPTQVSRKLATSLAALTTLTETGIQVATSDNKFKFDRDVSNTISSGSTLAETFAREGLEAMRYRALAAIVRDADPSVTAACVQLALWMADEEDVERRADVDALQDDEVDASERAGAAFQAGATGDPELEELVRRMEATHARIAEDDAKAKWRVFLTAAQAHRALRDALDDPADIEAAARAQKRLQTLVEQTIAFVEAVENL